MAYSPVGGAYMRWALVLPAMVLAMVIVLSSVPRPAKAWAASVDLSPAEVLQASSPTFDITIHNIGASALDIYYVWVHFCWLDPNYAYYFRADDGTTDSVAWLSSMTYSMAIDLPAGYYGDCAVEIGIKARGHFDLFPYTDVFDGALTVDPRVPLTASVEASPTIVTTGVPVSFTSTVAGGSAPYTYRWAFGDGSYSTGPNPSHTYDAAGVYQVVLGVEDLMGTEVWTRTWVSVVAMPSQAPAPGQPLVVPVSFGIQRLTLINGTLAFSATCNITVSMGALKVNDGRTGQSYLDIGPGPCNLTLYILNVSVTIPVVDAIPLGTPYSIKVPGVSVLTGGLADVYLDLSVNITATYLDMGNGLGTDRPSVQWDHWGADDLTLINITANVGGTGDTKLLPAPYGFEASLGLGVSVVALGIIQLGPWNVTSLPFPGTPPVAIPVAVDLPPDPVTITGAWAPSPYSLQVNWTPNSNSDLAAYDLRVRGASTDYVTIHNPSRSTVSLPASPGTTYTLDLWAVDAAGQLSRVSTTTVTTPTPLPPLQVAASAFSAPGNIPLTVAFSAAPTSGLPPYTYAWDFGDGTHGTGSSTQHIYGGPGDYTVHLTVTDRSQQSAVTVFHVQVTSPPAMPPAGLQGSGAAIATGGLDSSFVAIAAGGQGPYSYAWNFGDGATSDQQNPPHTYPVPGTYTVTLTVTDSQGKVSTSTMRVAVTGNSGPSTPSQASPVYTFLASMPRTVLYLSNLVLLVALVGVLVSIRRRRKAR